MDRKTMRETIKKAGPSSWFSTRNLDRAIQAHFKYVLVNGEKVTKGDNFLMVKREPDKAPPKKK